MYQLTEVLEADGMKSKKDAWHMIGKEYDIGNVTVGEKATLDNLTDSHMYRRVLKTSIIDNVKDSMKELKLFARDAIYILKKL
jgi:hypothetical protein